VKNWENLIYYIKDYVIEEEIDNLKVGDIKPYIIERFTLKVFITIKKYKEKVPEEFREKFNFDINNLENKLKILEGYLEALSKK